MGFWGYVKVGDTGPPIALQLRHDLVFGAGYVGEPFDLTGATQVVLAFYHGCMHSAARVPIYGVEAAIDDPPAGKISVGMAPEITAAIGIVCIGARVTNADATVQSFPTSSARSHWHLAVEKELTMPDAFPVAPPIVAGADKFVRSGTSLPADPAAYMVASGVATFTLLDDADGSSIGNYITDGSSWLLDNKG